MQMPESSVSPVFLCIRLVSEEMHRKYEVYYITEKRK